MNKTVNKFLSVADKFTLKLHLTRLGFTYSACGPFPEHCERIQKLKNISTI